MYETILLKCSVFKGGRTCWQCALFFWKVINVNYFFVFMFQLYLKKQEKQLIDQLLMNIHHRLNIPSRMIKILLYLALIPLFRPTPLIKSTGFLNESRVIFLREISWILLREIYIFIYWSFYYTQCNVLNVFRKHPFISKLATH